MDAGYKMVDAEEELYYTSIGTTKERYYQLILKKNKTEAEKQEEAKFRRAQDVLKYGEEQVLKDERMRREHELLSDEEKEEKRNRARASLNDVINRIKDL